MAKPPQGSDEVKGKVEPSLSDKPQRDAMPDAPRDTVKPDVADRSITIAVARTLTDTCNKSAADIQKTGESVVQVANGIAAETQALAELLRKHGTSIAARIEEFTALTKRVADAVEAACADVSGASGPPLAPGS